MVGRGLVIQVDRKQLVTKPLIGTVEMGDGRLDDVLLYKMKYIEATLTNPSRCRSDSSMIHPFVDNACQAPFCLDFATQFNVIWIVLCKHNDKEWRSDNLFFWSEHYKVRVY